MDEYCRALRQHAAEHGLSTVRTDAAALAHVQHCAECSDALRVLARAERSELPPAPPSAAPNASVASSSQPRLSEADASLERSLRRRSGRLGPALIGAAALLLIALGAWVLRPVRPRSEALRLAARTSESSQSEVPEWLSESKNTDEGGRAKRKTDSTDRAHATRNRFGIEGPQDNADPHMSREQARELAANAGIVGVLRASDSSPTRPAAMGSDPLSSLGALMGDQVRANFGFGNLGLRGTGRGAGGTGEGTIGLGTLGTIGYGSGQGGFSSQRTRAEDDNRTVRSPWKKAELSSQLMAALPLARARVVRSRELRIETVASAPEPALPEPHNAAEALLARYSTLADTQFIEANAYFANTYVPGDPELRALQARLLGYDRARVVPQGLHAARLDTASQRVAQPFDAPGRAALAVYAAASERGITSQRRMLLQIGLQATSRNGGRRPAMNIGVVLDARQPLDADTFAKLRVLLEAFATGRDPSDKLTLFAAGPSGGQLLTASEFRHGPLTVALERLQAERNGVNVDLPDVLQKALQDVRGSDDPNAPLGSSVAILIAPHAFGSELAQLETLAHESATLGVPVSVFGASPAAQPEQLARIALAGQGNRRMFDAPADAVQLVERELAAVARVVARAVRVRIRLAAGVRLLGVLGSHPLDEAGAERVREAENSIDQRLRQNLGITQDRGEDEEGVQIVIPSFYAGDSHVLLLDVVAEGPGLIADISVRYKDLVQLGNGSARESLWLPNLDLTRGPLQRNVLKNLAAYELANQLRRAGDALARDTDVANAQRVLDEALALLESLPLALPELQGDRELDADRTLTLEYRSLLAHSAQAAERQFAADSLHFAALLKLQPRPESEARTQ